MQEFRWEGNSKLSEFLRIPLPAFETRNFQDPSRTMPRYVILRHETPSGYERPCHWDFMLESGNVLRTWALQEEPHRGATVAAEALADHRLAYLDYEGPVSGNRGRVIRYDEGTYDLVCDTPTRVTVSLAGRALQCSATLERGPDDSPSWTITFKT